MPRRILVVDDEPEITDALRLGLEAQGFQVDTFNDPTAALSNLKPDSYDVAILDIRMPKMTGFDVYRQLSKIDPRMKIFFLTAFDVYRDEFEKMFPDMKVKAFLKKPITMAKLVSRIRESE